MIKEKFNINIYSLIIVLLGINTIFSDILSYAFKLPYILNIIISILTVSILFICLKKYIKIKSDFEKSDWLFFGILIFLIIIHIPFTDEMYDTNNYHLYLQERPFTSKLFIDFFPGRYINTFSYAFPDRMFYFFRFILGYRLGVILNYIILLALYYQCKNIIKKCFKISNTWVSIIAIFTVINLSVLEQIDNYYVDLLSLVFLLECFNIAFTNEYKFFHQTIYYLLLCGMAFATKISNAFFIILISLLYLFKNLKNLKKEKWWHYIIYVLIFCFPFAIYMFYTYKETGNPFFPFYNTIFKSEFYPLENWMDTRFGPKNFIEFILWPVISFFSPERVADTRICEPMWAFGYLISLISIIACLYKKIYKQKFSKNYLILAVITLFLYLIWSKFLLGYTRYALIVILLGNLLFLLAFYKVLKEKHYIISSGLFVLFIINSGYTGHYYMFSNYSLFYDNISNNTLANYKYNVKHIFDKNEQLVNFPDNSCWGVINENSGELLLINNELDILNLTWGSATEKAENILKNNLEKYDHIYTAVKYSDLEYFVNRINAYNIDILKVYDIAIPINLENIGFYYIFEIGYGEYNDNYELFYQTLDINLENSDNIYIGFSPYTREFSQEYNLAIYKKENNKEILVAKQHRNTSDHGLNLNIKDLDEEQVILKIEDDNGKLLPLNMILFDY